MPEHRTFVYSFRKEFALPILHGDKAQTIRQHRKDGRVPRAGDLIRLFTGMRTAACKKLGAAVITDCFPVYMDLTDLASRVIVSNGARLNFGEMESFAALDGFPSASAMLEFFQHAYRESDSFDGFCVRWRPLRPAGTRRRLRRAKEPAA